MLDSKRKSDTLPTYMALMPQSLSGSTQVLDILPIAASLLDEKGVVVYVNKVWRDYYASPDYVPTLLKPNANYLEACRDDQTDSRDASQTIYQEMIKLLDGEREQSTIEYINRWQGKDLWSSVRLARLSSGTQIYLLLLHEHISERKITELDLQEQQRLNELLREVAKKLASTLNVEEVMELILESVALLVPHDAANISLIEGDLVRAAYVRGYGEEFSRVSKAYRWPLHEGLYAEMMATRYPLVITDTDSSPLWRHVEGLNVVRSYVGVPIISQDQVQGFLNLDSFSTFEYTPRHLETLMAFAEHAAMAISNAQVYVTLDNFNAELSAILQATTALFKPIRPYETASDLAQDLIEALQQAFEGVSCGVFMRTDAGPDLKCAASVGSYVVAQRIFSPHESTGQEGLALLAAAFRTRQPVHVPRLGNANPGSITELVIPIITNRGVFALMHLQSREKDAFQERDMRILNAFAQHMAVAAENFQLYQTMQQHNTELEDAIVQRTLELRRAKEDVESILNSTSDAISVLDVQARIVKCNAAFESSFGIEADEAYRQSMSMFFTQESRSTFQTLFNRVLETGLSVQGELLAEWKQGEGAIKNAEWSGCGAAGAAR
ncbi:MAG: GAF domain-containing protein [Anaerolineae bacterium]